MIITKQIPLNPFEQPKGQELQGKLGSIGIFSGNIDSLDLSDCSNDHLIQLWDSIFLESSDDVTIVTDCKSFAGMDISAVLMYKNISNTELYAVSFSSISGQGDLQALHLISDSGLHNFLKFPDSIDSTESSDVASRLSLNINDLEINRNLENKQQAIEVFNNIFNLSEIPYIFDTNGNYDFIKTEILPDKTIDKTVFVDSDQEFEFLKYYFHMKPVVNLIKNFQDIDLEKDQNLTNYLDLDDYFSDPEDLNYKIGVKNNSCEDSLDLLINSENQLSISQNTYCPGIQEVYVVGINYLNKNTKDKIFERVPQTLCNENTTFIINILEDNTTEETNETNETNDFNETENSKNDTVYTSSSSSLSSSGGYTNSTTDDSDDSEKPAPNISTNALIQDSSPSNENLIILLLNDTKEFKISGQNYNSIKWYVNNQLVLENSNNFEFVESVPGDYSIKVEILNADSQDSKTWNVNVSSDEIPKNKNFAIILFYSILIVLGIIIILVLVLIIHNIPKKQEITA